METVMLDEDLIRELKGLGLTDINKTISYLLNNLQDKNLIKIIDRFNQGKERLELLLYEVNCFVDKVEHHHDEDFVSRIRTKINDYRW